MSGTVTVGRLLGRSGLGMIENRPIVPSSVSVACCSVAELPGVALPSLLVSVICCIA